MNENRPCKKELLEWINIVSFAVDDVKLFLDTHPNCPEALEFFDEFKKQRVQALKEYAKYYLITVRWTGWRIRSFFEIFFSEIYHAL